MPISPDGELEVNSTRTVRESIRAQPLPIVADMVWVAVVTVIVLVASVVAVVVLWRRLDESERTLRSVAAGIGSTDRGSALVRDVRGVVDDASTSRASASTYATALDGAPVGIVLMSQGGDVDYANAAASELLVEPGGTAILGTRVMALTQRVLSHGNEESVEFDVHDPERKILLIRATPIITSESGPLHACVYIVDRSEQRRIDAMRTDFVANASHELKTPLGALSLLAETLIEASDDETRARLSERLRLEANRMAHVVDDIIRLAETEALGVEHVPISLAGLVDEAAQSVDAHAEESGVEIVRERVEDVLVAADRSQLLSALENLLHNAITYTAVKDAPGVVRYRAAVDGKLVCLQVEDTGIGIPARYRDRVFERFFRVDRARSRESGGTGLGLSIVRNVAVAHGGTVAVESQVGVGSIFTLCLPIVQEDEP